MTHFMHYAAFCESESEVAQSRPTLCDPVDCSPPGSSVHGILQARVLEWGATAFSRGSSLPRDRTRSPALQADPLPPEPPGKPSCCFLYYELISREEGGQSLPSSLCRLWNGNRVIQSRLPVFHRARPLPFTSVVRVLSTFCVPCAVGDENTR